MTFSALAKFPGSAATIRVGFFPELAIRAQRAGLRSDGYAVELSRAAAGNSQLERRFVTEEQLGEALADAAGAQAEMLALTVRAPHDGRIFDLPADLVAGRWVNLRHPLLRVVNTKSGEIDAYLDESQIASVALGQTVHFYPDAPSSPVVHGTIAAIDSSARRVIPHPLLASVYGCGIAATQTGRDTLVAHEAIYRVRVRVAPETQGYSQVVQGRLRVEANWLAIGWSGVARMASVIVRETGF